MSTLENRDRNCEYTMSTPLIDVETKKGGVPYSEWLRNPFCTGMAKQVHTVRLPLTWSSQTVYSAGTQAVT